MKAATISRKAAPVDSKDFWLVYSLKRAGTTLADAIASLYYLPENFKLMVIGDMSGHTDAKNDDIKTRIQYETETEMQQQTSPFSFADAIIYDDLVPGTAANSTLIIAQNSNKQQSDAWNGFTVPAGSPEAIASAALNISRAAH